MKLATKMLLLSILALVIPMIILGAAILTSVVALLHSDSLLVALAAWIVLVLAFEHAMKQVDRIITTIRITRGSK